MAPPPVPTIDSVEFDEAIGRARIAGTVGAGTTEYGVYRVGPSGVPAFVRGVVADAIVGPASIDVVDYEAPFGVPLTYVLVARNVDGETEGRRARRNLIGAAQGYGDFETSHAPVTSSGNTTPSHSTERSRYGQGSARIAVLDGASSWASLGVVAIAGATAGRVYSAGVDLWAPPEYAGNTILFYARELGGASATAEQFAAIELVAGWQRLTVSRTFVANDRTGFEGWLSLPGNWFGAYHLDGAQLELGAPTDYDVGADTFAVDADWLVDLDDARNTGPVSVESFSELTYDAPQGVHRVIGRRTPVVTSDVRWTPTGRLVLTTATVDEARRVRDALGSSGPLLFRSTVDRGVGNMYVQPIGVVEQRISRIAFEPSRRWVVDVVEIDRPDPATYTPLSVTWGEVDATFATWAEVLEARTSWGDLLYNRDGLVDSELYSREPAFPPRDV